MDDVKSRKRERSRRTRVALVAGLAVLAVVVYFALLVPGKLAEERTRQTLIGPTWQMTSYNYLVFDGLHGDHQSDTIAIANPERYHLVFHADDTATLTGNCYVSTWRYTIDYGLSTGTAKSHFTVLEAPVLVPGCEQVRDVALDATNGYAESSYRNYLYKTQALELRDGALVLLRPMETDPFTGRYPDSRPLEQVFTPTPSR